MDGLELLTSVFLDDLTRNPTATREENPAGAAPDSDAPPGPGTRPMSPPSTQPAWTASAPPFLGAPAFRARQSLSRQGQDRRCLLAPLSTPAYSSASTPAVCWRATFFAQPYTWGLLAETPALSASATGSRWSQPYAMHVWAGRGTLGHPSNAAMISPFENAACGGHHRSLTPQGTLK